MPVGRSRRNQARRSAGKGASTSPSNSEKFHPLDQRANHRRGTPSSLSDRNAPQPSEDDGPLSHENDYLKTCVETRILQACAAPYEKHIAEYYKEVVNYQRESYQPELLKALAEYRAPCLKEASTQTGAENDTTSGQPVPLKNVVPLELREAPVQGARRSGMRTENSVADGTFPGVPVDKSFEWLPCNPPQRQDVQKHRNASAPRQSNNNVRTEESIAGGTDAALPLNKVMDRLLRIPALRTGSTKERNASALQEPKDDVRPKKSNTGGTDANPSIDKLIESLLLSSPPRKRGTHKLRQNSVTSRKRPYNSGADDEGVKERRPHRNSWPLTRPKGKVSMPSAVIQPVAADLREGQDSVGKPSRSLQHRPTPSAKSKAGNATASNESIDESLSADPRIGRTFHKSRQRTVTSEQHNKSIGDLTESNAGRQPSRQPPRNPGAGNGPVFRPYGQDSFYSNLQALIRGEPLRLPPPPWIPPRVVPAQLKPLGRLHHEKNLSQNCPPVAPLVEPPVDNRRPMSERLSVFPGSYQRSAQNRWSLNHPVNPSQLPQQRVPQDHVKQWRRRWDKAQRL